MKNAELHPRTKHIDIRYHFIRNLVGEAAFKIVYVSSENQFADLFTKPMTAERHLPLVSCIGCVDLRASKKKALVCYGGPQVFLSSASGRIATLATTSRTLTLCCGAVFKLLMDMALISAARAGNSFHVNVVGLGSLYLGSTLATNSARCFNNFE